MWYGIGQWLNSDAFQLRAMEGSTLSQADPDVAKDENLEQQQRDAIRRIAKALGETERKPIGQISAIVKKCGIEFADQLLADTLAIQNDGGMPTKDGKRKRTPGGVFFVLARERVPEDIKQEIFYIWRAVVERRQEIEAQFPEFEWEERTSIVQGMDEKGTVAEVKINLVGRPGPIERRKNLIILRMMDEFSEELVFPAGVPHPASLSREYLVYISSKQWERVEKALEDEKDNLIVEGLCGFDEETDMMAVFTTFVTTRKLQKRDRKQNQTKADTKKGGDKGNRRQATTNNKPQRNKPRGESTHLPPPTSGSVSRAEAEEIEIQVDVPEGMPSDAAKRYVELHKAAATFRQKIADIEAKPEDQRFGLEMTQKLLGNTERQIKALEKQHSK